MGLCELLGRNHNLELFQLSELEAIGSWYLTILPNRSEGVLAKRYFHLGVTACAPVRSQPNSAQKRKVKSTKSQVY